MSAGEQNRNLVHQGLSRLKDHQFADSSRAKGNEEVKQSIDHGTCLRSGCRHSRMQSRIMMGRCRILAPSGAWHNTQPSKFFGVTLCSTNCSYRSHLHAQLILHHPRLIRNFMLNQCQESNTDMIPGSLAAPRQLDGEPNQGYCYAPCSLRCSATLWFLLEDLWYGQCCGEYPLGFAMEIDWTSQELELCVFLFI